MIGASPERLVRIYERSRKNLKAVKRMLGRPMTCAEKIIFGHLGDTDIFDPDTLSLLPDRVALQDATGQMALLQFMLAGIERTSVPTAIHCDHLITACLGEEEDLFRALKENGEVYEFLRSASKRYGLDFWKPGSGIIHQVILENYAFPGGMIIGTDSHSSNAGGLAMFAPGAGGAEAAEVMSGLFFELPRPELIGVRLMGALSGWTRPKDIILKLLDILKTDGGNNRIVEYFGEGASTISCTGKASIANMGAELGATASIFPFDRGMADYLAATGRKTIADLAKENMDLITADKEIALDSEKYFERVIEIDLSSLVPRVTGPGSPDFSRPVPEMKEFIAREGYPAELSAALIGSCANSSYEDLARAAEILERALSKGLKLKAPLFISPGSQRTRQALERDGIMEIFLSAGAVLFSSSCGPCIGNWQRRDGEKNKPNAIITTYNRNFPGRNDGSEGTLSFLASPELCVAYALAGRIDLDPTAQGIMTESGTELFLNPPEKADKLPPEGFPEAEDLLEKPPENGSRVEIILDPESERLSMLEPFEPWDGEDLLDLPILMKVLGKCTTDHISPAGVWLKYRGHIDKISDNMLLRAVNAFTGNKGDTFDILAGDRSTPAAAARHYKKNGIRWVIVGDWNYGEGSSREHAAMSPRHLGAAAVIARSFARIHETNLKRQGLLPLTFSDPLDYEKVREKDRITISGLAGLSPGGMLKAVLRHEDGTEDEIGLRHTMSAGEIGRFRMGGSLRRI
ncbi:MAG TPA: aconitate hydratase [Acidobacteriota bacterium]|nr:aconitate hydratase [Acidobacteriota bacterium]HNT16643.1 aconitate hydratase [Acidobacteriota bacterium]